MKKLLGIFTITGIAAMALAMSTFGKVFNEHYKVEKGSALDKAACAVCHMSAKGGKLNPYGKDLQAAMKEAGTKKMTPAILTKVENMDSDKDGVKNIDEIKKAALPGDSK